MNLEEIVEYCQELYDDLDYECVKRWKEAHPGQKAIIASACRRPRR